jgi:hypothetical protein
MAIAVARKHVDTPPGQEQSPEMLDAITKTWNLVKARISAADASSLDPLIRQIVEGVQPGQSDLDDPAPPISLPR